MKSGNRDQILLESLNKCARVFLKAKDFNEPAYTVYETCKKLIGATAGYVALLSDDGTENKLLFLDMGDLRCDLDPDLPMPIRGLRAEAYNSNRTVYENNFQQSKWLQYIPDGHGPLNNVLFAPMVIDDKTLGIFGFANKPEGFNEDDVLVCGAFAEVAAIGLMQHRTMREVEKNVGHLNALMQSANDAIITVDQQGQICFWNQAAEGYFGYRADEIIGKSCTCIVPEKFVEAHKQGFTRFIQTGVSKLAGHQVQVEGLKKNGATFPAELSISKWEIDGRIFFTGIMRDISERYQMQKNIRTSEKRMREIFKMMQGGGGVYQAVDDGMDFIILEYHRPSDWENLPGKDTDLVGKRFLDVFPASIEFGLFEVFQRVWKTGKPEYHPVTIYEGKEIKSWRKNYVYKLSSGEIVALYQDITERKQMEKALIESENLFRSIFETSPDPININRLDDGKFVLVNSKFLDLTGYRENEVVGRTALELDLWRDTKKRDVFFHQLLEEWQVNDFEAEFLTRDGRILTALVSAKLLPYENKPHLLAVTKDITALKQIEQELIAAHGELAQRYKVSSEKLKETEIKYSALLEALLVGVYMCVEDDVIFVNNQFGQIFGYDKEEILGMNMLELLHPEDRNQFQTVCNIPSPDGSAEGEFEIRGIRKDGDIIYLSGRNTSIEFNGRHGILGNVTNITRRKEAENELKRSEDELRLLSAQLISAEERERKRIAGDIHDSIGQVLSAIKFSVESSLFAISEQSYSTAQESLEKLIPLTQQSIDEVRRIIMDLRPTILDDLGLLATISWFCREFGTIYTDIGIEKEIQLEEGDIPDFLKIVIYRILQEALSNAAKYSETEYIYIKLAKTRENLELLIADKGRGFDPAEVAARKKVGRGMGLASMKERALLSGGRIDIRSR